jgi:hypothetical protein
MKYVLLFEYFSKHDDILDKISKNGVNSLTPEEVNLLKNINKVQPQKDMFKTLEIKKENDIYFDIEKNIIFKLLKVVEHNGALFFNGIITFEEEKFTGHILYDESENYKEFEFYSRHNENFDPKQYYKEWEKIMEQVINDNK